MRRRGPHSAVRPGAYLAGSHPESVWFHGGAITVDPYTVGRWCVYGPWTSDAEYVGSKEKCLDYANKRTAALEAT